MRDTEQTNGVHFKASNGFHFMLSPVNYLFFFLQYNILGFYGAVDSTKWRQMMNFSEARVVLAHAAHKSLFSMQFVYDIFMGFKLKT